MATVQSSADLQNIKETGTLAVVITRFLKQLLVQINGNIQFKSNIRSSSLLTANFTSTNSNLTITHDLGGAPVGFLLVSTTAPMNVFTGSVASTSTTITLQSNAVGTATLYAI